MSTVTVLRKGRQERMAVFTFRLEQVLRYRIQLEDEANQRLAEATRVRDAIRTRIAEIDTELLVAREALYNFPAMSEGERYVAQTYEASLRAERKTALIKLLEQDALVEDCRIELTAKAQERSLLEKLKEKQAQRHAKEELLNEQRTNDETATLRFNATPF